MSQTQVKIKTKMTTVNRIDQHKKKFLVLFN